MKGPALRTQNDGRAAGVHDGILRGRKHVADSRVSLRAPLRILCQTDHGSCAACCGVDNFVDRSPAATKARLRRRTEAVTTAWPNPTALAAARDILLAEERPHVLFPQVLVCPFAGYVTAPAPEHERQEDAERQDDDGRVGCLLHPTRHPDGADLRDLAVYPREVCAGHFCAPHDWLRPREVLLAQAAQGLTYGRVVTDARLVKAIDRGLTERCAGTFSERQAQSARPALTRLWHLLLVQWPWRDPDARRFGGFVFDGDDARDRSVPSCVEGVDVPIAAWEKTVLDAVGTRPLDHDDARRALSSLRGAIDEVVSIIDGSG